MFHRRLQLPHAQRNGFVWAVHFGISFQTDVLSQKSVNEAFTGEPEFLTRVDDPERSSLMPVNPADGPILGTLYGSDAMRAVFDERAYFQRMLGIGYSLPGLKKSMVDVRHMPRVCP